MRYYFDWAASTPPEPLVLRVLNSVPFGNPSSKHSEGEAAHGALEKARSDTASVLTVNTKNLFWTSCGSESNAIIIFSFFKKFLENKCAVLSTNVEHASTGENLKTISKLNCPVFFMPVNKYGVADKDSFYLALKKIENPKSIKLASIMFVQNETGAINDIKTLSALIKNTAGSYVHVHTDAVQALGKIPFSLADLCVDSASFSAHKLCAPRGAALLYLKKQIDVLISGGGQEGGIRSGTENTAAICAFAKAISMFAPPETVAANYDGATRRMNLLISELKKIKGVQIIPECRGINDERFSPYILQCSFAGIPGEVMRRMLDDAGFAVSTGSACSASQKKRPILEAMGVPREAAFNAIRISQGFTTTTEDVQALIEAIQLILRGR